MGELLPPRDAPATDAERVFLMGAVVAVLGAYLNLEDFHLTVFAGKYPLVRVEHFEHGDMLSFRVVHDPAMLMRFGKAQAWKAIERDVAQTLSKYIEQIEEKDRNVDDTEREPGGTGADEGP